MAVDYTGYQPPAPLLKRAMRVPGANVLHLPGFIGVSKATDLFEVLRDQVAWREEYLRLFGHRHRVPRQVAWYGDAGVGYRYSGQPHHADGWLPPLAALRDQLLGCLSVRFNFALANRYRDGNDAMGLHADDESELGVNPVIASLSFGGTRRFRLVERNPTGKPSRRIAHALDLRSGDLLLMWGDTQSRWLHGIPRTRKPVGERINLTFRSVQ